MNLWLSLLFLLLFKVNNIIRGSNTHEIIIDQELKTLVIDEGDELIIRCNNTNTFTIVYPETDIFSGISTSKHEITSRRTVDADEEWLFHREKTVFGDTGWYKCIETDRASYIPTDLTDIPLHWGVYVYVQSLNNLFVQTRQHNSLFIPVDQTRLYLPCRATIPSTLVDIININSNAKLILNKNSVTYDSTKGFRLIMNSSEWDGSSYKCQINKNLSIPEISYNIKVINKTFVRKPIIDKSSVRHVIKGQILHVYCNFKISEISDNAIWVTPRDPDSRQIKHYASLKNDNLNNVVSELIVENVTFNDMGLYTCKLEDSTDLYAAAVFVRVYDSVKINYPKEIIKGDDVTLECVSWYGNVTKSVRWLNENNEPLQTNETINDTYVDKISNTSTKRAFLYIRNIQKSDSREYMCSVKFLDNATKIVRQKIIVTDPEPPYFFRDTRLNKKVYTVKRNKFALMAIVCSARGAPKPKITWYKDHVPINYLKRVPPKNLFDDGMPLSEDIVILFFHQLRDDVNFSCIAKNRYGEVEDYAIFRIIDENKRQTKTFPFWTLAIVGFIIIILICMIYICIKIQCRKVKEEALREIGLSNFNKGNLRILHLNWTIDEQTEYLPYHKKWEFKRKKLKLGKQLGGGAFGNVVKAEAKNISAEEKVSIVAVKIVSREAEPIYINAIAKELKILMYVGRHLSILNLLGTCTDKIAKKELLLIMEYCCFGNLYDYLLENRNEFINQIDPNTGKIDSSTHRIPSSLSDDLYDADDLDSVTANSRHFDPGWRSNYCGDYNDEDLEMICTQDLMSWSFQIACGMEFLHQKKVVHGDLAAKNILLTKNNVVKICDFGLARTMYANENYRNFEIFPVKWMAIESIRDGRFSLQSDIWSFAVVLWELFSLCNIPYSGILSEDLAEKLSNGYRMDKPKYAIHEIYDIMLECWKDSPNERPSFIALVGKIGELLDEEAKMHYAKLNASYAEKHDKFTSDEEAYLHCMSISDDEDDSTSQSISNIFSEEIPVEMDE